MLQRKKSTEGGGRLAHQKSIGSKEKKMHNAAKSLEHRIAALGNVEAPEDIRRIRFRQSKALELHNPYPIVGTEINKIFGDKALFENASFQFGSVIILGDLTICHKSVSLRYATQTSRL